MKRKLWPYVLVFVLGLVAAQSAVNSDQKTRATGREWQSFPRQGIALITYEAQGIQVQIESISDNLAWISFKKGEEAPKRFLGREGLDELWKGLDPLWAQKLIGDPASLKLVDYGLDPPQGSLRIKTKDGRTSEFVLGHKGFQSADVFVLDPARKAVFLWERKLLGLLDMAPQRLAIEQPLASPGKAYAAASLQNAQGAQAWVRSKGSPEESKWKRESGEEDASFAGWFDRLQKLRIDAYASSEESQAVIQSAAPKLNLLLTSADGTNIPLVFVQDSKDGRIWLKDQRLPVLLLMDQSKTGLLMSDAEPLLSKK